MPLGIDEEYIAFFLSGTVFGYQSGSIAYYARRAGVELVRRRDLIASESQHPRANNLYFNVAIDNLCVKSPNIPNISKRRFAFIRTTWDRFAEAKSLEDLYSDAFCYSERDYFKRN